MMNTYPISYLLKVTLPSVRRPSPVLWKKGHTFRNAYTPSPVCVPARQSFLSCLYPRNCGCLNFGDPMPTEVRTIPGHLGNYGYYACCAGKMHFVGTDIMHGWQERTGHDIIGNNGYPFSAVKDEYSAQFEREPGTGMKRDKTAQEIRDAQPGIGHWMLHDQYNVDGALLFLEEYFVNASYDRPRSNPQDLRKLSRKRIYWTLKVVILLF